MLEYGVSRGISPSRLQDYLVHEDWSAGSTCSGLISAESLFERRRGFMSDKLKGVEKLAHELGR